MLPRAEAGTEESARWVGDFVRPVFLLMMAKSAQKRNGLTNMLREVLYDFHAMPAVKILVRAVVDGRLWPVAGEFNHFSELFSSFFLSLFSLCEVRSSDQPGGSGCHRASD